MKTLRRVTEADSKRLPDTLVRDRAPVEVVGSRAPSGARQGPSALPALVLTLSAAPFRGPHEPFETAKG